MCWCKPKRPTSPFGSSSLVGEEGLEPSRLAPLVPKTSVSTNSTTRPYLVCCYCTYSALKSNIKCIKNFLTSYGNLCIFDSIYLVVIK